MTKRMQASGPDACSSVYGAPPARVEHWRPFTRQRVADTLMSNDGWQMKTAIASAIIAAELDSAAAWSTSAKASGLHTTNLDVLGTIHPELNRPTRRIPTKAANTSRAGCGLYAARALRIARILPAAPPKARRVRPVLEMRYPEKVIETI